MHFISFKPLGRSWQIFFPRAAYLAYGALLTSGFSVSMAHAARPMITDDARIVDAKSCQLESWLKKNQNSTEYWALPACNFTGNLELTLGGASGNDDAGTKTTDIVFQGKTLFKTLEPNGWAWGLVMGNVRHPAIQTDRNLVGDVYAYLPASFSFRDDRFVLHTNIGWLHDKTAKENRATWGVGTETQMTQNNWLIAEAYGQNQGNPFYQLGVRHWLVPNRVQIDTTYGSRFDSSLEERWFSIGLRLLSVPFLP